MEPSVDESKSSSKIGDRSTSDVVVRIRTQDGRDDWIYCHSHILISKSKYYSDRLSDNWPTCQILDSRNCVEVHCEECDFDYHINILRIFYSSSDVSETELCGVKNALGTLRVAVELGCPYIISTCVGYLEAIPWEESEEEEILKIIPNMGPQAEKVLARLQPVNPLSVRKIFLSAMRFATSSPSSSLNDLKTSAQEQLEYMLTEDDDTPLLTIDESIKVEVSECINKLLSRFASLVESLACDMQELVQESKKMDLLYSYLTDLSWVSQILAKLKVSREVVRIWVDASVNLEKIAEQSCPESEINAIKLKLLEVTSKILEEIGNGTTVLPTTKRLQMVQIWLPYVRSLRLLIDSAPSDDENDLLMKFDGELWSTLESSFVSIILTLPSGDQAQILTDWLGSPQIRYPDLTEAFEVWCYRSRVSKKRLALFGRSHKTPNQIYNPNLSPITQNGSTEM